MFTTLVPSDRYGVIYLMTHRESGKQYVGQTTQSLAARMGGHRLDAKRGRPCHYLDSAIAKYGFDAFNVETLDWAMTKEELDHKECFWIAFLDTMETGYNLKSGGARGRLKPEIVAMTAAKMRGKKQRNPNPNRHLPRPYRQNIPRALAGNAKQRATMLAKVKSGGWAEWCKGKPSPKRRPMICVETGEHFPSTLHAALWACPASAAKGHGPGVASALRDAAKTGRTSYGYHWQFAETA